MLFAVNGRYLINEKAALIEAAAFPLTIAGLDAAVADIWDALGHREFARLLKGLTAISEDLREAVALSAA